MTKCIIVDTRHGQVNVQVADGTTSLPKSDLEQLEAFIAMVKARATKRKPKSKEKRL